MRAMKRSRGIVPALVLILGIPMIGAAGPEGCTMSPHLGSLGGQNADNAPSAFLDDQIEGGGGGLSLTFHRREGGVENPSPTRPIADDPGRAPATVDDADENLTTATAGHGACPAACLKDARCQAYISRKAGRNLPRCRPSRARGSIGAPSSIMIPLS